MTTKHALLQCRLVAAIRHSVVVSCIKRTRQQHVEFTCDAGQTVIFIGEPKFSGKKGLPGPICSSKGEEKEHLAHLPPLQLQRTQLQDTRENPAP